MSADRGLATLHWCPRRCGSVQLAKLDGETVVFHPKRMTALALNATASSIWELCDGERTLSEIIDLLCAQHPEAAARIPREVEDSALALLDHGVISAPRIGPSAATCAVGFGGTAVTLEADSAACAKILAFLCGNMSLTPRAATSTTFRLGPATRSGSMAAYQDDVLLFRNRSEGLVATIFVERMLAYLIDHCTGGMLLHAAALARNERALVLAGKTGAGKTTLATWLVHRGFDYLTDELVRIDTASTSVQGFARPLHVKEAGRPLFEALIDMEGDAVMKVPSGYQISPARLGARAVSEARAAALIFPTYRAGARFDVHPLSKAQVATRTMGCLVNAREHLPHGFDDVADLVRAVPAFTMVYANLEEAGERLETLFQELG